MSTRSRRAATAAPVVESHVDAAPRKVTRKTKKEEVVESSSESEPSSSESSEEEAAPKPKAKKAAAKKAAAATTKSQPNTTADTNTLAPPSKAVHTVHTQLVQIFSSAQHSFHTHVGLRAQAESLLKAHNDVFMISFSSLCAYLCSKPKKDANSQRVLEWVGTFVSHSFKPSIAATSAQFGELMIEQIVEWSEAKDKTIRWRAVQIIAEAMKSMDEECDLPEWLFDRIMAAMLVRAEDKIESVRVAAAAALHRFQSGEERDPVAAMYVRMMSFDTAPLVRKAALEHVAATSSPKAMNALLARTQDVAPAVRAAAFKAIQSKLSMKVLSVEFRARLIRLGFKDRDAEVVKAAKSLMESWLESKENDVIRLMKSMAVDTFSEECGLLIAHLVRSGAYKWTTTVQPPYASHTLTPERALYWRVLSETLQSMPGDECAAALDVSLPDTVELCRLLQSHSSDVFMTAQLLALTGLADMADEAGRRELGAQIEYLLRDPETSQSLVSPLMKVYRLVHSDENDFIRVVLEQLHEIHDPQDTKRHPELAAKREELHTVYTTLENQLANLKVHKQAAINADNIEGAEQIKNDMCALACQRDEVEKELNSLGLQDDGTWARLLSIVCDLLENTTRFKLNHPGLAGLREGFIQPGIQHDHPLIQSLGLKALSLYALLDRATAKSALPMFLYAANHADTLAQQATAMRAVTDILMLFEDLLVDESTILEQKEEDAEDAEAAHTVAPSASLADVQALFNRHMQAAFEGGASTTDDGEAEVTEVCVMAVECLAKLLLFGRIPCSPPLLSALLFIFFHPSTDTRMTQCLAVFLPGLLLAREEHVQTFLHSVLPTVRILATAVQAAEAELDDDPAAILANPWKGFSIISAGRAMLSFVSGPLSKKLVSGRPFAQSFAMELCAQLNSNLAASSTGVLVGLLASMDLALDLQPTKKDTITPFLPTLYHALSNMQLRDKHASKELTKFLDKLLKTHGELDLSDSDGERADEWLLDRTRAIQVEQHAESHAAAAGDASGAESQSAAAGPKKKLGTTKPTKKTLRPKTPAKEKKAAKDDSSDDDEEDADGDSDGGSSDSDASGVIRRPASSASVSSSTGRPVRGARLEAATKIAADKKKQRDMDKVIDAESEEEEEEE